MAAKSEPDPPRFKIPVEGPPRVRMPSILDAAGAMAREMRERHRMSAGSYLLLPQWMVARSVGWDAFCTEFEASHERAGLHHAGVIGFEVETGIGRLTRKYTVKRYREQEAPE